MIEDLALCPTLLLQRMIGMIGEMLMWVYLWEEVRGITKVIRCVGLPFSSQNVLAPRVVVDRHKDDTIDVGGEHGDRSINIVVGIGNTSFIPFANFSFDMVLLMFPHFMVSIISNMVDLVQLETVIRFLA